MLRNTDIILEFITPIQRQLKVDCSVMDLLNYRGYLLLKAGASVQQVHQNEKMQFVKLLAEET